MIAKERKGPHIVQQLLLYPSTGHQEIPPSFAENADGYFLTLEMMNWFKPVFEQRRGSYELQIWIFKRLTKKT